MTIKEILARNEAFEKLLNRPYKFFDNIAINAATEFEHLVINSSIDLENIITNSATMRNIFNFAEIFEKSEPPFWIKESFVLPEILCENIKTPDLYQKIFAIPDLWLTTVGDGYFVCDEIIDIYNFVAQNMLPDTVIPKAIEIRATKNSKKLKPVKKGIKISISDAIAIVSFVLQVAQAGRSEPVQIDNSHYITINNAVNYYHVEIEIPDESKYELEFDVPESVSTETLFTEHSMNDSEDTDYTNQIRPETTESDH